jgi:hypothetical protein
VMALVIDTTTEQDAAMKAYLTERKRLSTEEYSFSRNGGHNCGTLICDALRAAGRSAPSNNSYLPPLGVFLGLRPSQMDFFTYFPQFGNNPPVACVETSESTTGSKSKTCN